MMAREFTHPNFGKEARLEVSGCEVRLIFVASTAEQANDLAETILEQLEAGAINITMMGKPTSVVES